MFIFVLKLLVEIFKKYFVNANFLNYYFKYDLIKVDFLVVSKLKS